jgi:hypothetical protein
MGIIKLLVLHLLSAGFLAAGVASATDPFFAHWCFALALGAFVLAWATASGKPADQSV